MAGALKGGKATRHKVIITVKPGYRAAVRKALQGHGDKIKREHGNLNLLETDLDSDTILELVKNGMVQAMSLDVPVRSYQLGPLARR